MSRIATYPGLAGAGSAPVASGTGQAGGRTALGYRADIDGLRAIAVVAVLLYHVGLPGVGGGFLGVDIFFVISGYLICGVIDAQLRQGTFSLGDFYKRRILRIVPALVVTMLATSVLAYLHFLPVELKDYARSLVAAAASVSNMYFASTAGYFDSPALTKPLLHTWSLGVEEQFYVATPILMLLAVRFAPRHLGTLLVLGAAVSFVLAGIAEVLVPVKAFYYAPFRAWEFLLGALLSTGMVSLPRSARLREAAGLLGLAMILGAVVFGSHEGRLLVVTSIAVLGTTLVIASRREDGARSTIGRVLSLPPIVFVGLVSYSVYLWHWPLTVFLRPGAMLPDSVPQGVYQALVVVLSLVLGIVSWRYVERPFRDATAGSPRRLVFGGFAGATVALAALGFGLVKFDGLPGRFPPRVVDLASYLAYDPRAAFRQGSCYLTRSRDVLDEALCLRRASDRLNYLLVGDSFAAHLWHGLAAAMPEVNLMQASMSRCRPVIGPSSGIDTPPCPQMKRRIFDGVLAATAPKVDKVFLAASWKDEDIPALLLTLDDLRAKGQSVVVLGPLVEYRQPLPRLLASEMLRGDPAFGSRMQDPSIPLRDEAMRKAVLARGAQYLSLYAAACPEGVCIETTASGFPLQFDTGHLTAEGSVLIARRLGLARAAAN